MEDQLSDWYLDSEPLKIPYFGELNLCTTLTFLSVQSNLSNYLLEYPLLKTEARLHRVSI